MIIFYNVTDQIPWANEWMIHDVKIRDNDVSDISSKRYVPLKFTNPGEPCYYTLNHTFLMFFWRGKAISNGICNMTNDIEGSNTSP